MAGHATITRTSTFMRLAGPEELRPQVVNAGVIILALSLRQIHNLGGLFMKL